MKLSKLIDELQTTLGAYGDGTVEGIATIACLLEELNWNSRLYITLHTTPEKVLYYKAELVRNKE